MTTIIKRCRGEKTRGIRAIDGFRNKLMIPDSEISKCPKFEIKLKQGTFFKIITPLKNILLGFIKLILIFMNTMKKKYKLIITGANIFYLEQVFNLVSVLQQQKLMKNGILIEILLSTKKDKKHQKKTQL